MRERKEKSTERQQTAGRDNAVDISLPYVSYLVGPPDMACVCVFMHAHLCVCFKDASKWWILDSVLTRLHVTQQVRNICEKCIHLCVLHTFVNCSSWLKKYNRKYLYEICVFSLLLCFSVVRNYFWHYHRLLKQLVDLWQICYMCRLWQSSSGRSKSQGCFYRLLLQLMTTAFGQSGQVDQLKFIWYISFLHRSTKNIDRLFQAHLN